LRFLFVRGLVVSLAPQIIALKPDGRRRRYLRPTRLFLVTILFFFATIALIFPAILLR